MNMNLLEQILLPALCVGIALGFYWSIRGAEILNRLETKASWLVRVHDFIFMSSKERRQKP